MNSSNLYTLLHSASVRVVCIPPLVTNPLFRARHMAGTTTAAVVASRPIIKWNNGMKALRCSQGQTVGMSNNPHQ